MSVCKPPSEYEDLESELKQELAALDGLAVDLRRHWDTFHSEVSEVSRRWYRLGAFTSVTIEIGASLRGGVLALSKLRTLRGRVAEQSRKVALAREALKREKGHLGRSTPSTRGRIGGHTTWANRGRRDIEMLGVRQTRGLGTEAFKAIQEPGLKDRSTGNLPFVPGMTAEWERMVDLGMQSIENLIRDRDRRALLDFAAVVLETADLAQWLAKAGVRATDAIQAKLDLLGETYAKHHAAAANQLARRRRAVEKALEVLQALASACGYS